MKIGLIDADSTSWRNLHLMKRAAYHKARGDEALFPYDGATPVDKVFVSTVFTRNRPKVERMLTVLRGDVEVGGTGWDIHSKAPPEVEAAKPDYSIYDYRLGPANYGQGFTSRGCPRGCPFCVVPEMSGRVAKPIATLADIRNGEHRFIKLMDDNFWAPGNEWRERLLEAIENRLELSFTQGLDIRFVDEERASLLARTSFWNEGHTGKQVTFAFDSPRIETAYRRGFNLLIGAGIKPYQIASFVLTGFDSLPEDDDARIQTLRELGAYPFVMVYEPIKGEKIPDYYKKQGWTEAQYLRHWKRCKHLQRWTNHRAIWKSIKRFEDYGPWVHQQRMWAETDRQVVYLP